jgi:beta-glucosidase
MKKLLFLLTTLCFYMQVSAQTDQQKAEALIKKMTIEEKVGQMTQVTLAVIAKGGWGNQDGALDPAALKKAIIDYKVGSVLNTTAHALSVDKWREVITQIQDEVKNTKLKIPVIYGLDAMHGQTYTLNSTLFPHNVGLGSSTKPEMAVAIAKVTAKELRASGVRWNFAPVLDIGRQPLWSRFPKPMVKTFTLVKHLVPLLSKHMKKTD